MKNIDEIRAKVEKLAEQIKAPKQLLPSYDGARINHPSYIENQGAIYNYVVTDSGREVKRKIAFSPDELLYFIFVDITFEMAVSFGKGHRSKGGDFRRILFNYQLGLMERLNMQWKVRREQEIAEILKDSPHRDLSLN